MTTPRNYLFNLPSGSRPQHAEIAEEWYPGIQAHWPHCTTSRKWDAILGVKAVVIHATAGVSSSGAISVMRNHTASWHWLVPDEDEEAHGKLVWACSPEARAAWHVRNDKFHPQVNGGAKQVNHWSLGVEIVNSQLRSPVDTFSDWQVSATANIVRYCWAKYPNLTQVVSHAVLDPERRSDPGPHFPWERFCDLVVNGTSKLMHEDIIAATTPVDKIIDAADAELCCMSA